MKKLKNSLLTIILLAAMLNPTPARADVGTLAGLAAIITGLSLACGPLAGMCSSTLYNRFMSAVHNQLAIFSQTAPQKIAMKSDQANAAAISANTQTGLTRTEQAHAANNILHGPTAASCAIDSIGQSMMMGGAGNTGALTAQAALGGPGATTKSAPAATAPAPPRIDASGNVKPVGKTLNTANNAGVPYDSFIAAQAAEAGRVQEARMEGTAKGSENQWLDTKTQFNEHTNQYGGDQTDDMFKNADIRADTVLGYDTYPLKENVPDVADGSGTRTMRDAAEQFCQNISHPDMLAPNHGQVVADNIERQAYSNKRDAWAARLSLVNYICMEAVGRRTGKQFDMTAPGGGGTAATTSPQSDWFTDTVKTFKQLNCIGSSASSCQTEVAAEVGGTGPMRISEYEMMKTVYTRLLFTPAALQMLGGASETETLKMMTHLDQLQLSLNYKMYELQQKLAMIKAAQLGTMVAGEKTSPEEAAPTQ